jgi:tetratricopeptide (TPR) repeat protein
LVAGNLDDREGAIKFLDQVLRARRRGGRHLEDETGRLEQVGRAHKQDGDVLFKLAMVAERDGDSRTALDLLGRAARAGYQGADLLLRRGVISLGLGNEKDAIEDLKQVLLSRRAEPPDLLGAVGILLERRPDVVVALADNLAAAAAGDESTRIILAERLLSSYLTAPVAERISRGDGSDLHAPASLSLALIAQQKFAEAMSVIGESEDAVLERDDLRDLFNYAMAAWGEKGRPPEKIFRRVLELTASTQDGGANMHQCVALAAAATGEPSRAREELAKSRAAVSGRRDVSCWRYLEVPSIEFQRDLDSIERMLDDPSVIPEIFRPRPTSAAQPELPLPK